MEEGRLLKRKNKAIGNVTALISACTDLAAYYISAEKFSKAINEYEILCGIYKDEKKMILYAQANRGIGEAYMGQHEFDKALKHFKIYYEVAVKERNLMDQQRALAQLGHLYLTWYLETFKEHNTKLLDEAYGYFIRSMKKCEGLSDSVEKQDMLARLFSNLGLVKENLGDYKTSLSLYEKSMRICLKHDIYEQLYRGYLAMASLFEKQEMYQETIKKYNLAIEIAKKLSSKRVELICAALLAKSETLIKIADFQGAKQVLRKAYKFKTPNKKDNEVIQKYLRVVAAMCKIEDDIITCNDQKQLKNLYEEMGDGACDLKNFTKAIEYYKKMLEAAEKNGVSGKELGECYYSLGETYKDIGNFKEAEIYYEKEYSMCKNSLKDGLNTICKLADLKEMANDSVEEIKTIYERGLSNCKKRKNLKEEKRLVLRYIVFLKRSNCHKDLLKMDQQLSNLEDRMGLEGDDDASSSSEYESEDSAKVHIGDNIVLSDVTDISEESDNEVPEPTAIQPSKRRRQNAEKFKKNLKGEWPLHVACIKGNPIMVQYWLDIDHPVNVRDNAGWLPLHEAAVHGYVDIVGMLLDHKASINDRGGSECGGITPLHDAASNGHLEVIELLLDRGASAVAKTDDGNTPLLHLKKWFDGSGADMSGERLSLYNRLIQRMEEALDKAGQRDQETEMYTVPESDGGKNVCTSNATVGRLRTNIYLEETPEEESEEESSGASETMSQTSVHSEKSASSEYQRVMQTLRHKNYSTEKIQMQSSPVPTAKRSALIDEGDFVDDWLEDDVRPTKNKKRKTGSGDLLWGRSRSFGGGSSSKKSPAKSGWSSVRNEDLPVQDTLPDFSHNSLVDEFDENSSDSGLNRGRDSSDSNDGAGRSLWPRRRTQATLLDAGFSRQRSSNSPTVRNRSSSKRFSSDGAASPSQAKITNYGSHSQMVVEADSTTLARSSFLTIEATQNVADPMLFVDVEIEGRVFRVPVRLSQLQVKTIKWLAKEAAHRYESKEYMKPVLELETANGAILGDSDQLSLLFPMGSMQAERVVGKVTEWSLPSVMERYQETCTNMGVDIDNDLIDLIQTLSVTLDISDRGLLASNLSPLLKAINNQKALTEINLSGNFLNAHCMTALTSSLVTLPNLQTLNLSCTGLHRLYLSQLASTMSTNATALDKLVNLDLSDNLLLKGACLQDLCVISRSLNLKRLNLCNTGLGDLTAFDAALRLKTVDDLDVSYNALSDADIRKIVSWLDGTVVKRVNVSRNAGQRVLRQVLDVFETEPEVVLEELDLEGCGVSDSDFFELLRLSPNLTRVNLSYNPDLTSISLRRLLERGNFSHVNVTSCLGIWTYFEPTEKGWSVEMSTRTGRATFKISGGSDTFWNCLVEMFQDKYGRGVEVTRSSNGLSVVLMGST